MKVNVRLDLLALPTLSPERRRGAILDLGGTAVSASLIAIDNDHPEMKILQPLQCVFRIDDRMITADMLAEELLIKLKKLKALCRRKLNRATDDADQSLLSALERCALIRDGVQDGHFDPGDLDSVLVELRKHEPLLPLAFFLSSLDDRAESVRSALLRSSYHLARMSSAIEEINRHTPLEFVVAEADRGTTPVGELRHVSKRGDAVADEFASGVLACYSSLDLLRKLFDFIVREPLGSLKKLREQHFMDRLQSGLPVYDIARPLAIPSIALNEFQELYLLRSDLVHNVGTDYLRALIYIGIGLEPVNGRLLQYAQYMTRDVTASGSAVAHGWVARFYKQKRDGQEFLLRELTRSWQVALDTVDWMIHHISQVDPPNT